MAAAPDRLEIGRIVKPHGLRGELIVAAVSDVAERFEPGSVLQLGQDQVAVIAGRQHQGRLIVRLEGVDDRNAAELLRGETLWGEPLGDAPEGGFWVHELIGARVVDVDGVERGTVRAVVENPAHDLLELEDGRLVPMTFVVEQTPHRVVVDTPAGLFDL